MGLDRPDEAKAATIDLAPVPDQMTGAKIRDLLEATDYLIVNEHEALDVAAALDAGVTDFEAACSWLARSGGLTCVVTAGAQGALAVTADDTRLRAPSPSIRPVDTTGAGDTFVGAFASMIGEKSSLKGVGSGMRSRRLELPEGRCSAWHADEKSDARGSGKTDGD